MEPIQPSPGPPEFDAHAHAGEFASQILEIINNSNKLRGRPEFIGNITEYEGWRALAATKTAREFAAVLIRQVFRFTRVFGEYRGDLDWLSKYSKVCARVLTMQIMLDNISHHVYNAEYYYDRTHDNIYTAPASCVDSIETAHEILHVLANPPEFMPRPDAQHDYILDALGQIWRKFGFKSKKL